jgi:hypothetical protein
LAYIFDLIGTLVLLLYGVLATFFPRWSAPYLAITLDTPRGVAEFRVIHGGFIAMAIFLLVVNHPLVYMVIGVGWLGAAAARLLAILLDRPALNATYIISIVFEAAFGLMMIM